MRSKTIRTKKIKKLRRTAALATALALAITGCGKGEGTGNNSDISQELNKIEEENSAVGDTGQDLSAMLGVDEGKWIETFDVQGDFIYSIKIGATVDVPDVDGMSIVTMNELQMDNAGRKEMVEKVCGKGEIYSFDDKDMPKWFWEKSVKDAREEIERLLEAKNNNRGYFNVDNNWGNEDEAYLETKREELAKGEDNYEKAPEMGMDVGDYSADRYTGMTDKGRVVMYFNTEDNRISWDVMGLSEYCNKDDVQDKSAISLSVGAGDGENLCSMSEEEAKNYAISYISKLGYTDYVVDAVNNLVWEDFSTSGYDLWTDGYVITLARDLHGKTVDYAGYFDQDNFSDSVGEYILLEFNDVGVIHCTISHPREIKEVVTEKTEMLSYTQVKNTMKSILSNKAKDYQKNIDQPVDFLLNLQEGDKAEDILTFSEMELIYYAAKDAEQGIIVLPAWRLSSKEDWSATGSVFCGHPLVINAIDGSEINVWE